MTNYATQQQNDDMMSLIASQFRLLYNPVHAFADAVAMLQMFPGLRGLWTMGQFNSSVQMIDISGNGLHLSRSGSSAAVVDSLTAGFPPRAYINATTAHLLHADASAFDLIGNESYVRSGQNLRGMTIGMWIRPDSVGSVQIAMSKWAASNASYSLSLDNSGGENTFFVSGNGTTAVGVTNSGAPLVAGDWVFICGRYRSEVPDIKVWMNDVTNTNATSIPSTLFNGNAEFRIGQRADSTAGFVGRGSLAFLCHVAVPDIFINTFYQMTAPLFNVSI